MNYAHFIPELDLDSCAHFIPESGCKYIFLIPGIPEHPDFWSAFGTYYRIRHEIASQDIHIKGRVIAYGTVFRRRLTDCLPDYPGSF